MASYIQGSLFDYTSPVSISEQSSSETVRNPLFSEPKIPAIPVSTVLVQLLPSISHQARRFEIDLKYGEVIGGSHYDRFHFLGEADILKTLEDMTTAIDSNTFNRDVLWPEPNWVALVEEGYDPVSLYRIKVLRQSITQKIPKTVHSRIQRYTTNELKESLMLYGQLILYMRDSCMKNLNIFSDEKIMDFAKEKKEIENSKYRYSTAPDNYLSFSDIFSFLEGREETFFIYDTPEMFIDPRRKASDIYIHLFLRSETKRDLLREAFTCGEKVPFTATGIVQQENWPHDAPDWTNLFYLYREKEEWNILDKVKYEKTKRRHSSNLKEEDEYSPDLGFPTFEDAKKWAMDLALALSEQHSFKEKKVEVATENTSKDEENKRLGELVRPVVSEPYRNCKNYTRYDITPEEFQDIYGFRALEFGKWLPQKERKGNVNEAHAAFMDLCAILKLPVKAISLGGELAAAFGARGIANAAAHYEPLKKVINLTRFAGAGALAHEWMHAVDYAAGRHLYGAAILSGSLEDKKGLPDLYPLRQRPLMAEQLTERIEVKLYEILLMTQKFSKCSFNMDMLSRLSFKSDGTTLASAHNYFVQTTKEVIDAYRHFPQETEAFPYFKNKMSMFQGPRYKSFFGNIGKYLEGTPREKMDGSECIFALNNAFSELASLGSKQALDNGKDFDFFTQYYKDAQSLDTLYGKKKPYWSNSRELFARAGEFYVASQLQKNGIQSQYLVYGALPEEPWTNDKKGEVILETGNRLFDVVKGRELAPEHLQLFQRSISPYPQFFEKDSMEATMSKAWDTTIRPALIEMTAKAFPDADLSIPPLPKVEQSKLLRP